MSLEFQTVYRMSEYPHFPMVTVYATTPIDADELRDILMKLKTETFAGKLPSFDVVVMDPDTEQFTTILNLDRETQVEAVDLSSIGPEV